MRLPMPSEMESEKHSRESMPSWLRFRLAISALLLMNLLTSVNCTWLVTMNKYGASYPPDSQRLN